MAMTARATGAEGKSIFYEYLTISVIIISVSALCYAARSVIGYHLVSLILLLSLSLIALFFSAGPVLAASALSALIWDFFFIPPSFTLHIGNTEDTLMLGMFFIVALINGTLTSRIKRQEMLAKQREERTLALYHITRQLLVASDMDEVEKVAGENLQRHFSITDINVILPDSGKLISGSNGTVPVPEQVKEAVLRVMAENARAGMFSRLFPDLPVSLWPLRGSSRCIGAICFRIPSKPTGTEEQFLEACIDLIAGRVERELLGSMAKEAFVLAESDKLYKTLFNSISHELRIPVAAIMGATDTLLEEKYPEQTRRKLYLEISKASVRLNRLIENLLNISRLESGHISPKPDWCDIQDLANKVVQTLSEELGHYLFSCDIMADMPLVRLDFGLSEQMVHNLLLNAMQNSPEGSLINVSFSYEEDKGLIIIVSDRGKGFTQTDLEGLFNKFFRGKNAGAGGTGLGLSIVKGFAEAQGGRVLAANRHGGGAEMTVIIPTASSDISNGQEA